MTPRALPNAVARCVAQARGSTPATLSAALITLGETTLYEDGCRLDLGPRARDPSLCEPVTEGPLRSACLARTAMALASPELCPPALGIHGRDPVCVAIAARRPGLCAAAMILDRPVCLAIARQSPEPCAALDPSLRPRCEAEARALAGVLAPMRGQSLIHDGHATLRAERPGSDAAVFERPLRLVSRGVWLDAAGSLWLVDPITGTRIASINDAPAMAVQIFSPRPRAPLSALCRLAMPGDIDRGGEWLPCEAQLNHAPRGRGDRATGRVILPTRWHLEAIRVTLEFDSFVRDTVDPATLNSP